MAFKVGDYVTRISHKHDIVFKILRIEEEVAILKGVDLRLQADCEISDLVKVNEVIDSDKEIISKSISSFQMDRSKYFYLPGKILHIDGDEEYLERCMNFYANIGIKANGISIVEPQIASKIMNLINDYRPDIVVITGHDAYLSKSNDKSDNRNYQNSINFIEAIKQVRKYEKSQDKLVIIAGACQSNYEELIKAGANFASSPKRINIHALDPAIIASSIALSDRNKSIDLMSMIEKTKYGSDGIGGIITNGTMYTGYPR